MKSKIYVLFCSKGNKKKKKTISVIVRWGGIRKDEERNPFAVCGFHVLLKLLHANEFIQVSSL